MTKNIVRYTIKNGLYGKRQCHFNTYYFEDIAEHKF